MGKREIHPTRRDFLKTAAAGAAVALAPRRPGRVNRPRRGAGSGAKFKLKYAPPDVRSPRREETCRPAQVHGDQGFSPGSTTG